jgi:isopentenyl-diphosphate delta-isomerase type 1
VTATEYIVLVDEQDRETGTAEKLAAHVNNQLHRAFSVFIFRRLPQCELLLQQRASGKYHCPDLWTNTCCSHPRPGETILAAGERRLQQELGFTTPLKNLGWFHYNVHFDNGLSENEIDHVLIGEITADTTPAPNPEEVRALRWVSIDTLKDELTATPQKFTPWLLQALEIVSRHQG